ncbi:MAG: TolC family protein [Candidatus Sericytochromatia bacterium]|nr:TolC family protein [Candidatus Sericytochromatia bacterium]
MFSRSLLFVLVTGLSCLPGVAWAEDRLSLTRAVSQALTGNPRLRAAEHQIAAAKAREIQAAAFPNPNLTLIVDQVPLPNPLNGNYMAGISQPLWLGGQHESRMAVAKLDTQLAELDYAILRREMAANVRNEFARLLLAQAGYRFSLLSEGSAATIRKAAESRYKAGEVARIEVLQAQVEHSRAQREVAAADSRQVRARGKLNILLGQQAQSPIVVDEPAKPERLSLAPVDDLIKQGLTNRPELRRAALMIQHETLQQQLARTSVWTGTEVTAAAGAVAGQAGFSATMTVPIPIYQQQGEVAEANADRLRAEAERLALANEITLDVQNAYHEARSSFQLIELFQKTYLQQAERLADNARRRFVAGEGSGFEVLEARRSQRDVQAAYQQVLLEYRQALTNLERAVGQDLADMPHDGH